MSHGLITRDWADGTYSFRIAYGQWLELQESCHAGPLEIYTALLMRRWRVEHIREIVRVGLIGAGTDPATALRLVKRHVEDRPIMESVEIALNIVAAALAIPAGEPKPGEAEAATSASTESTSPLSTETVQ